MHNIKYDSNGKVSQESINAIAERAVIWAQGSWGQSEYDCPRYDNLTMEDIYSRMADICIKKANFYATRPPQK
jgi:hypothetical protein